MDTTIERVEETTTARNPDSAGAKAQARNREKFRMGLNAVLNSGKSVKLLNAAEHGHRDSQDLRCVVEMQDGDGSHFHLILQAVGFGRVGIKEESISGLTVA